MREVNSVTLKAFSKHPARDMEVEWQLSGDKVRTSCGLGHSEVEWPTFTKPVRTPRGGLRYASNRAPLWL